MRVFSLFVHTVWVLFSAGSAFAAPVLIENVNVLPMDSGRVLADYSVLIDHGRIVALGATGLEVPAQVRRIDGAGGYLIPGLVEMHAHIPPASDESLQRVLTLFLANGVTTVRGMLGHPSHLALRTRIENGELLAPRLITSGPSLNGNSVNGTGHAAKMVRAQSKAGYDFLKLHPGLNSEEFTAIVATARELGMPFAGHVSDDVGLVRALEARQDSIDHLDGYMQYMAASAQAGTDGALGFFALGLAAQVDADRIVAAAKETAAAGVSVVPTQSLIENVANALSADELAARPEMRYMPAATVRQWRNAKSNAVSGARFDADLAALAIDVRRRLIRAMHEEGVRILLGSDAPQIFNVPGFSLHRELETYVASGLDNFAALRTGTVLPAEYFSAAAERGHIAPGQAADLVLLRSNPLDDIGNTRRIEGVMRAGRWLSRADLDQMLEPFER